MTARTSAKIDETCGRIAVTFVTIAATSGRTGRRSRNSVLLTDEQREPTRFPRGLSFSDRFARLLRRCSDGFFVERWLRCHRRVLRGRRVYPRTQDFGDAPGLCNASPGQVWFHRVEDLANGAKSKLVQRRDASIQKPTCTSPVFWMHLDPRVDPRPDEPRPHRALMVRGIARAEITEVAFLVIRIARRE